MYYNGLNFKYKGSDRAYNHNKKFKKLNKPKYAYLATKVNGYRFKSKNNSKTYCLIYITNPKAKIRNFNQLYKANGHSIHYKALLHKKSLFSGFF